MSDQSTKRIVPTRAEMAQLTGVERTFNKDEFIVTKTDLKGRIKYANNVFYEMAGYTEKETIGAPHSLIRHPEMPHCIFKLLWDTIKQDKEVFAYVNNRSKNGDNYWVLAHVTPSYDKDGKIMGYHSNRRVPSKAALKEVIIPLYEALNAEEAKHRGPTEKAKAGLAMVEQLLNEKGVGYDEFIFSVINAY